MEFTRVPRPVQSGPTGGGRKATPSEFQDVVNALTLADDDAAQVFVPFADADDNSNKLEGRVCRSLVKAGKAHPEGPFTVNRRFEHGTEGASVTIWLAPLQVRPRNTATTAE